MVHIGFIPVVIRWIELSNDVLVEPSFFIFKELVSFASWEEREVGEAIFEHIEKLGIFLLSKRGGIFFFQA